MGTGAQGGYFAVTTWLPTFLRTERELSVLDSAGYLAVLIVGAFCGYLCGGFLADRIGRRLTLPRFRRWGGHDRGDLHHRSLRRHGDVDAGFSTGVLFVWSIQRDGSVFHRHFPTRVRGIGQGFAYNLGSGDRVRCFRRWWDFYRRGFRWARRSVFPGLAYATMAIAAFLLPETRGKVLAP